MRTGTPHDAGRVFDALVDRDQIRTYPTPAERTHALTAIAATATASRRAAGQIQHGDLDRSRVLLVADTREQVTQLNAAIRERLVAGGHVDDTRTVTTFAGERIGVGDRITTRRNDRDTDVANRDTWTVTGLPDHRSHGHDGHGEDGGLHQGGLVVAGPRGQRVLPPAYVRDHVELAYATTVYGSQGATTSAAHLLVGDHTGAAGAYVAMTRGRHNNTAHLVADTVQGAREQWVEVFTRDRADLGPAHAARLAAREAAPYATHRPLAEALTDLRDAWAAEYALTGQLTTARARQDQLTHVVALYADHDAQVASARATLELARDHATRATGHADQLDTAVDRETTRYAGRLWEQWDTDRPDAAAAAQTIRAGTGRFGQHRGAVRRATHHLDELAERWRPILGGLPTDSGHLAVLANGPDHPTLKAAITDYARQVAEGDHPDLAAAHTATHTAARTAEHSLTAYEQARTTYPDQLDDYGDLAWLPDPARNLAGTMQEVTDLTDQLGVAQGAVRTALADPAIRSLPSDRLESEHQRWATETTQADQAAEATRTAQATEEPDQRPPGRRPGDGGGGTPSVSKGLWHERSTATYTPPPSDGISR